MKNEILFDGTVLIVFDSTTINKENKVFTIILDKDLSLIESLEFISNDSTILLSALNSYFDDLNKLIYYTNNITVVKNIQNFEYSYIYDIKKIYADFKVEIDIVESSFKLLEIMTTNI